MKKKILITGSTGFVGTNFIKMSYDYDIVEIDLLLQKVDEVDFSGVDSVLHLAALVHQMGGAPEEQYFKINCDLAFETAKHAKSSGVKQFVLMSTAKVFGESTSDDNSWNENSDCNPKDAYGRSKLAAEKLIRNLQDEKFKVAIVRSPLVYGPGVKANMFNLIKLADKLPILPFGGIKNKRSMVYVGNLVALLQRVILTDASGIFIAGNNSDVSTTELVQQICRSLSKKRLLFTVPGFFMKAAGLIKPESVNRLTGSLVLDNKLTNASLDFNPPYSFEHGINEMVSWYKLCKTKG
jgi:nucleoside-diphosphate-sugar epimerase